MPLLTNNNIEEIADSLYNYYLSIPEELRYKSYSWAAHFGQEDSYLLFSKYMTLFSHSLKLSVNREQIVTLLEEELSGESEDVIIVWGEFNAWGAVKKDPDGKKCFEKTQEITYIKNPHEEDSLKTLIAESIKVLGEENVYIESKQSEAPIFQCLECGATFEEVGHVEPGGMGCDFCNC